MQILEDSKIARQQLSDITNRHNDVLKLEKSLTEIKDMFTEIAFLVEKQVSAVDNKIISYELCSITKRELRKYLYIYIFRIFSRGNKLII